MQRNMYQAYVSDEGILFIRHFDNYMGAEVFTACIKTLENKTPATSLKAVCIDLTDVTSVTLDDTDRALGAFMLRKIQSYGLDVDSLSIVRVYKAENLTVNKTMQERDARVAESIIDVDAIVHVHSLPEALKVLGLPADYQVEYPPEKK